MFKFSKKTKSGPAPVDAEKLEAAELPLSEFAIGQSGVIVNIGGDGKIRRRLFDMGVTPGADVYLRKKAPLGDPIEVTLRGYELTLRKTEAAVVTVRTQAPSRSENDKEADK